MLKIKILIIIFCCIGVVKAQTVIPPSSETPPGWIYYDGDEFNGDVIDSRYWGIYGSQKWGDPPIIRKIKPCFRHIVRSRSLSKPFLQERRFVEFAHSKVKMRPVPFIPV